MLSCPTEKNKSANGIIIPYGESIRPRILSFLGGGYYHQFKGGKLSSAITGDIYSKVLGECINLTKYKVRYKYNGQFQLNYRNVIQGEKGFEDYAVSREFFIEWNHQNDPKLNPGSTFKALINAGTSSNFRNDYNNPSINNYLSKHI